MDAVTVRADQTAGNLLREARSRRDMTQRDLAVAAGVPQSMIAKIEAGSRQPSIPTLTRLITAAGFVVKPTLMNAIRPSQLVAMHRDQLLDLAHNYGISRVRIFGSVARGEDQPNSDVDLLIDLSPNAEPLEHLGFAEAVEQLLGCKVDVVTTSDLHELVRAAVLSEAQDLNRRNCG